MGSALAGPRELMTPARRHRKLFGGTMRQPGIIAAGALYAIEHHINRLAEDHANAQRLAEIIRSIDETEFGPPRLIPTSSFLQSTPESARPTSLPRHTRAPRTRAAYAIGRPAIDSRGYAS